MPDHLPPNDLDRAVVALHRSESAMPELYRQLGKGDLSFLVPYHPEVEGEMMELTEGMALPFSQIADKHGPVVPLFSSVERAQEAMDKFELPPRTYAIGSLDAKLVLGIIGRAEQRAVVNKGCKTGEVTIPADLMRDVASGKILEPVSLDDSKPTQQQTLKIIDPADYPTDLIQPIFESLRRHRNFRAAWILGVRDEETLPIEERGYQTIERVCGGRDNEPSDLHRRGEFASGDIAVRARLPRIVSAAIRLAMPPARAPTPNVLDRLDAHPLYCIRRFSR